MKKECSIVIPIRSGKISDENIIRLERLLSILPNDFEVVVVNDGSSKKVSQYLENLAYKERNFVYVYLPTRWSRFSIARARNRGAQIASSPVIFFHDVDFIATEQTYLSILKEIETKEISKKREVFFCVPVGFLTSQGTKNYLNEINEKKDMSIQSKIYINSNPDDLKFFVQGSSAIVCNRENFINIGGHNEYYKGHGAEDFELLHRLAHAYPIAQKPPDYSTNMGSGNIKEYRGFRAYFALYGLECKNRSIFLVHLFHEKRKTWGYYQSSRKNFQMLKQLMEQKN